MKKQLIRLSVLSICLIFAMASFSAGVYAIDPIDLQADVSLSVSFRSGETAIPNAEFSVYQVADIDEFAAPTLAESFSAFSGELNGSTASEWDAVAQKLATFANDQKIQPSASGKTDSKGVASFSDGLTPGFYLVTCADTKYNDFTYTARPALVCLPNRDNSENWCYDVQMNAKAGEPKPNPKPPKPVPPTLPQTGLLWWPVPVLLFCGLLFVIFGLMRRKTSKNEE